MLTPEHITTTIYKACGLIEELLDQLDNSTIKLDDDLAEDEKDFWKYIYDELYNYTTEIEEYYGLI